jgi:hypothetical protein
MGVSLSELLKFARVVSKRQTHPAHNRRADYETLQDQLWYFSKELVKDFVLSEGQAHDEE